MNQHPLTPFLEQQGFVMLDGGLATELEKHGHNLDGALWSASLLDDNPGAIQKVHRSYLEAGADCIIAASYQASIPGFLEAGFSEAKAGRLIQRSVEIAVETRDRFIEESDDPHRIRPAVAASIGPYGAYLADGSEYRGDYLVSNGELRVFHESRWEILAETAADLFAIETIPSSSEAGVLLDILESTPDIFAWISFSCADGVHMNDGTPIRECTRLFAGCAQIVGIGVNCTAPQHISSLIGEVRTGAPGKPIVVYPNSGERYDGRDNTWDCRPEPTDFGAAALEWFNLGARILGGCCRTGPARTREMKNALRGNLQRED